MTVFVIVATIMVLAAVSAIIIPLLRKPNPEPAESALDSADISLNVLREQLADMEREFTAGNLSTESYLSEKSELERRALEDGQHPPSPVKSSGQNHVKLAVFIGIAVPLLVFGMYYKMGAREALDEQKMASQAIAEKDAQHALTQQQIEGIVDKLSKRLLDNPDDGTGWHMLGRTYAALGRYAESADAYSRAVSMLPPDAQLFADFAEILAMTQDRQLQGEPEKFLQLSLQTDPKNIKALALSGTVAFERNDYKTATNLWRKVLDIIPQDSDLSDSIRSSIADAESKMNSRNNTPQKTPPANANKTVSGSVMIDPALHKKVGPDNLVFIFAHAVNGPRMPLAILRKHVSDLPFQFSLDDNMSMTPDLKLSQFDQITVSARISKNGDALRHSGDFESIPVHATPGAKNLKITIAAEVK